MSLNGTRTKCPVKGCPGFVDINTNGSGKTVDRCECCEKRRAWEIANAPKLPPRPCRICGGVLPRRDGRSERRPRTSGVRHLARRAAQNRSYARQAAKTAAAPVRATTRILATSSKER